MPKSRPTSSPDPAQLWDRSTAAGFLGEALRTLDRHTAERKIPSYKLPNGRVMYDPDDLRSLVASGYRPVAKD